MKPQNQVTVTSSETGLTFRMNRSVAERHDTLTILDDEHDGEGPPIYGSDRSGVPLDANADGRLDMFDDLAPEAATPNQSAKSAGPDRGPRG